MVASRLVLQARDIRRRKSRGLRIEGREGRRSVMRPFPASPPHVLRRARAASVAAAGVVAHMRTLRG